MLTETSSYQAFTNQGFLLREAQIVARRLLDGATIAEIQREVTEENLLDLRSVQSRKTIFGAVAARLKGAPNEILHLLTEPDLDSKRLTNFYLILLKHRLLRDFMADVVLEQLRRLSYNLPKGEVLAFFDRKREEISVIESWSDATYAKAQSNLLNIVLHAGLLEEGDTADEYLVRPTFAAAPIRDELTRNGHGSYLPLLLDGS